MRGFQGVLSTAFAYSSARMLFDKDVGMRSVWGWFATASLVALIGTALVSWLLHSSRGERKALLKIAKQIASCKNMSFELFVAWDKQLRSLFREAKDSSVRRDAFDLWDTLCNDWIEYLRQGGKTQEAEELQNLVRTFKERDREIQAVKEALDRGDIDKAQAMVKRAGK